MLKGENIICISSIDWDFIWQGHQEIMSVLAENGNTVLFVENTGVRSPGIKDISRIKRRLQNYFKGVKGIRKERDNLYIYSPLVVPFPYARIARIINKYLLVSALEKWMRVMDFSEPIIWTFLPTGITLDIIYNTNKKLVVYYCIDNFSASSTSAKKIKATENKLLKEADLVFVTSQALYDMCAEYNKNVTFFPFGVSLDNFQKIREESTQCPQDLSKIKGPIIGYVGGLHKWIDFQLLKILAQRFPQYSFVFIGPQQTDISLLSGLGNVFFLGGKDHRNLALYVKGFDVCLIPYLISEYTNNVYPTKMNEYLSMGKPVISTALPEVLRFNREHSDPIYIGKNADEFAVAIENSLKEDSAVLKKKRIEVSQLNSWKSRIEQMSVIISQAIEKRKRDKDLLWKEKLLFFYKTANRRVRKLIIILVLGYFIVFQTPFIWFLASPLKIDDVVKKADAIVVFGGGVGETGSPGKSTIERARFAADLYKKGFASKVIFSSGYTYKYNDAENMKVFAVSMGVPKEDIMLELKANNAYENVLYSSQIVRSSGLSSIILISAPYNMKRVSLVYNKIAKDIKVDYVPVANNQFYNSEGKVKLEQIKAIFHEYLGIAYYFFKGYI